MPDNLAVYNPDGRRFLTTVELAARAELAESQLEEERSRSQQLLERLRSLGIDSNLM